MRQKISLALKRAMRDNDDVARSTLRLMMAAIKDADIAARSVDSREGLSDDDILELLQTMKKQRRKSEIVYRENHQKERADRELAEIAVIESFLPQQMSEEETRQAIGFVIDDLNIQKASEIGDVLATMKKLYPSNIDMKKVAALTKDILQEKFPPPL